jgi:NAD(P)-dependent dehydrogenase (short-subunit alcohol dehydrogenase family)
MDRRIAVVTGASSGIGEATVLRLAREGWTVVAAARRADASRTSHARAAAVGSPGACVPRRSTCATSRRSTRSQHASLASTARATCSCATPGIGGGSLAGRDDLEDALEVIDVNLAGTLRCCAAFADLLAASAPSQVINVASVAGKLGLGPAAYVASKFGMVGLSEALGSPGAAAASPSRSSTPASCTPRASRRRGRRARRQHASSSDPRSSRARDLRGPRPAPRGGHDPALVPRASSCCGTSRPPRGGPSVASRRGPGGAARRCDGAARPAQDGRGMSDAGACSRTSSGSPRSARARARSSRR